jgi:uncharacterized ion transporter superfamily protein YfcC
MEFAMDQKAGAQISIKAFIQSAVILFVLMIAAGVVTLVIPAGSYSRIIQEGRSVIDPNSFQYIARPDYPIWRWLIAPIEVLGGPDNLVVITIILFILLVGGAFAVMDKTGILNAALSWVVKKAGGRKYVLLLAVAFFFMFLGAFFGLFEEIVPLVPIMIALAYSLGWDALVGLGMSILATNMGFSAALTNPFTIGVAQRLAGLPLFSGFLFRIPIFLGFYAILAVFLYQYARKIDKKPEDSLMYGDDQAERAKYKNLDLSELAASGPGLKRATIWFLAFVLLITAVLIGSSFISALSDYSLPIVGILFFIGGLGAGFLSGAPGKTVWSALWDGVTGIAPGIPLLLMAASVKYIVASGGVMDTILHTASNSLTGTNPTTAVFLIFVLALVLEIFISSAGAKAVLMMPILLPLADLVGVTRQSTVLAYCFGDGFSNMAYPTNPVLLICLGLASIGYGKWMRWTWKMWAAVVVLVLIFLTIAVLIHYGPF